VDPDPVHCFFGSEICKDFFCNILSGKILSALSILVLKWLLIVQGALLALPQELQMVPQFGWEWSLNMPLTEPRVRSLLLNAALELQPQGSSSGGDGHPRPATLTHNSSPKLKNAQLHR
jgi:hypothetical protein